MCQKIQMQVAVKGKKENRRSQDFLSKNEEWGTVISAYMQNIHRNKCSLPSSHIIVQ